MALCFHYKLVKNKYNRMEYIVPCGQCLACKINKAYDWATRCMMEMEYYDDNNCCFLTLTYAPKYLPKLGTSVPTLVKKDLQDFVKRLRIAGDRKKCKKLEAFFGCGEYGSKRGRPHYHLLCFGFSPDDLIYLKLSPTGYPIYRSPFLTRLWKKGHVFVGVGVNEHCAGYVARYVNKKLHCKEDYHGAVEEFCVSSRNIPYGDKELAIGGRWCLDHLSTVYRGYLNDRKEPDKTRRIPRYFEKLIDKYGNHSLYEQVKLERKAKGIAKSQERSIKMYNMTDEEKFDYYLSLNRLKKHQEDRLQTLRRAYEEE